VSAEPTRSKEGVPSDRRCLIAQLRSARGAGISLTPLVTAAATALDVDPRTVWRWLAAGPPRTPVPPPAWWPSPEDLDAYVAWKGNAAEAWRARRAEGAGIPTLRTFQRAVRRALERGDRAVVREGVTGRRRHQVYLRWEPEARNQLWETDHTLLEVPVLFPRCRQPRRPWLTSFIDGYSRAMMGWAISDQPSAATVLAALGAAIRVDSERGPFGGIPSSLRCDGGLEFAAEVLTRACAVLAIRLAPTRPYSPHLKGKVERLHGTIAVQFLADMPHFVQGPRDAAGRLWGADGPVLTLAELVSGFDLWVASYNRERPHQGLDDQTPLQRWCEDAAPLRVVGDEELYWTLLADTTRKVITSGIRFHGLDFIAPELNGLVGERLEVRFRPHDDTSIEVFRAGVHLCTARPQGALDAEQRAAILARRRTDAAEQARRQRRAARRIRERHSPVTARTAAEDLTVVSGGAAAATAGLSRDAGLRRMAKVDLLVLPGAGAS
jgi:putative transposase